MDLTKHGSVPFKPRKNKRYTLEPEYAWNADVPSDSIGAGEAHATGEAQRKRLRNDDPSNVEGYLGPWAGYEGEKKGTLQGPTEAALRRAGLLPKDGSAVSLDSLKNGKKESSSVSEPGREHSVLHAASSDYMKPPKIAGISLKADAPPPNCFIPKRLLHTWKGHTKGVNVIRFIPKSGHLLISGGMDGLVKLWDVYHKRECLRTFYGHGKAIRDICFNDNGTQFLSASYDRYVKLWNTESGECLRSFTNGKLPLCIKIHPSLDMQNIFLVGCKDKRIYQYDLNTGEIEQEYNEHLGGVNSITFIDQNRRFVTTSDDKTVRVWDFGIPVAIKYLADESMHSIPTTCLCPTGKWMLGQSLDNQILLFSAGEVFKKSKTRRFTGHVVSGYACQPTFSADGKFVVSGDGEGRLWFWDFKTAKLLT